MEKRHLGKTGIEIAPLAFGGNVFGWTVDEATSFRLLDAFVDEGFTFIDTADVYYRWAPGNSGGESETIIGKWLKTRGNRADVVIATKVGHEMGPDKKGLSAAYIIEAVEKSLTRLQTDYIDLYQSHVDDLSVGQDQTMEAYDTLRNQGKIRCIGASNFTAERLSEALQVSKRWKYPAYVSLQPNYNLYDRADFETNLESLCLEKHIGVLSYFSLASGFLTGKYRSADDAGKSPRGARALSYLTDRGFRILKALDQVSAAHNCRPATIALAWLIQRPSITAPIASATSLEQLKDLTLAARLRLTPEEVVLLDLASAY